jgi:hypothetical protein
MHPYGDRFYAKAYSGPIKDLLMRCETDYLFASRNQDQLKEWLREAPADPYRWGRLLCSEMIGTKAWEVYWREALAETADANPEDRARALHLSQARLALHFGELSIAKRILDQIDPQFWQLEPACGAMQRYLDSLWEGQYRSCVPLDWLEPRWWYKAPFLVADQLDRADLRELIHGLVYINDDQLIIDGSHYKMDAHIPPRNMTTRIPMERWKTFTDAIPKEEDFVEIGSYNQTTIAKIFPHHTRKADALPQLPVEYRLDLASATF